MKCRRVLKLLCDVMVSIEDFGSSRRGSNPLTTTNQSNIFKVKQAKPDEVKSLHTKMSYGFRRTLIKIISGLSSPAIA